MIEATASSPEIEKTIHWSGSPGENEVQPGLKELPMPIVPSMQREHLDEDDQ